jgi:hypothetical protein
LIVIFGKNHREVLDLLLWKGSNIDFLHDFLNRECEPSCIGELHIFQTNAVSVRKIPSETTAMICATIASCVRVCGAWALPPRRTEIIGDLLRLCRTSLRERTAPSPVGKAAVQRACHRLEMA